MSKPIELVVFDMAGTTVQDKNEVEKCFFAAVENTGLKTSKAEINAMMGWSKIQVFETLWRNQLANRPESEIIEKVNASFAVFKDILENHYRENSIYPTHGTLALFSYLKSKKVKIAITTGFYREVTDIILTGLGWQVGETIDVVIASDEVKAGRPAPYMIFRAMEICNVSNVKHVVKIGDTPSDIGEGVNAGCRFSFGVTNGTHTKAELQKHNPDGLFADMIEFGDFLRKEIEIKKPEFYF